jgi:Spy/CpxP family protein refolding chaperone
MKNSLTNKAFIGLLVLAILGFGANAFAGWGMGCDQRGSGYHGPGWHHDGRFGPGNGYRMDDLSDDEIEKLHRERKSFFKATQDLRQDIYAKELSLRSELAKKDLDTDKAQKLQKEISDLEAKMDQKRIDHMINMRKINPNAGRSFMGRGGMGYGRSFGGYCWR